MKKHIRIEEICGELIVRIEDCTIQELFEAKYITVNEDGEWFMNLD